MQPSPLPIRVLVAEDEQPLRDALCDLIASEAGLEVAGSAGTGDEAVALAASLLPDVAIVDVRMPGGGPGAARGIREQSPRTSVLGFSAYEDHATVLEMLRAGASGYLVEGVAADEIVEAIRRTTRGQASLSTDVFSNLTAGLAGGPDGESLRRSEARFRALLESAPDAVVDRRRARDDRARQRRDRAALRLRARGAPRPSRSRQLLPDRFRDRHAAHRDAYLADPRTRPMGFGLELAGLRSDRTEFPVDISLSRSRRTTGVLATAFIRGIERGATRRRSSSATSPSAARVSRISSTRARRSAGGSPGTSTTTRSR